MRSTIDEAQKPGAANAKRLAQLHRAREKSSSGELSSLPLENEFWALRDTMGDWLEAHGISFERDDPIEIATKYGEHYRPDNETTISQAVSTLPSGQAPVDVNFALRDTLYRPAQGGPPLTSEQLLRYQEQAQIAVDRWAEAVGIYPDGVTITNDTDAFVGGATYRNGMPMPGAAGAAMAEGMEANTWGAYEANKDSLWLQDVMPSSHREFVGDVVIFQDTVAHELGHRMEAEFRDAIRDAVGYPPPRYMAALTSQLGYEGVETIRREYIGDLFQALTSTMAAGGAMPNLAL